MTKKPTTRKVPDPSAAEARALAAAPAELLEGRKALLAAGRDLGPKFAIGRTCAAFLSMTAYELRWAEKSGHFGRVKTETVVQEATGRELTTHYAIGTDRKRIGTRDGTVSRHYSLYDIYQIVLGLYASGRVSERYLGSVLGQVWARALTEVEIGVLRTERRRPK